MGKLFDRTYFGVQAAIQAVLFVIVGLILGGLGWIWLEAAPGAWKILPGAFLLFLAWMAACTVRALLHVAMNTEQWQRSGRPWPS